MSAAQAPGGAGKVALLPGRFNLTDTGNAERFVAQHRADVRYVAGRDKWLYWEGSRWAWDETGAAERLAKATARAIKVEANECTDLDVRKAINSWALKSEGIGKRSAMLSLARYEPGMTTEVGALDLNPWLLNCKNGTVDLRTCELLPAKRDDMITKTTGVEFDRDAISPLWCEIVRNMTGGNAELERYLQRVAGYALTGFATERRVFFLYGPPGTGKSTFIEALLAGMGDYARSTSFDTWVERPNVGGNRDDLVALQGVRLVTSAEVSAAKRWDTSTIKGITGGDRITATAKFESQIEFYAQCTLVLAANDAPRVSSDDDGFWERMMRIPITYVVPEDQRVKGLHAKLRDPEVSAAILAWAVEGCRAWQETGIGEAEVVRESNSAYRSEQDWLGGFLEEYEACDGFIPAGVFRDAYERYCKQEGQHSEPNKTLVRRIQKRFPAVRYRILHGVRQWYGLRAIGGAYQSQENVNATHAPVTRELEQQPLDLDMPDYERFA